MADPSPGDDPVTTDTLVELTGHRWTAPTLRRRLSTAKVRSLGRDSTGTALWPRATALAALHAGPGQGARTDLAVTDHDPMAALRDDPPDARG